MLKPVNVKALTATETELKDILASESATSKLLGLMQEDGGGFALLSEPTIAGRLLR